MSRTETTKSRLTDFYTFLHIVSFCTFLQWIVIILDQNTYPALEVVCQLQMKPVKLGLAYADSNLKKHTKQVDSQLNTVTRNNPIYYQRRSRWVVQQTTGENGPSFIPFRRNETTLRISNLWCSLLLSAVTNENKSQPQQ